ncbi:MAG: hypothetical protein ACLUD2_20355 [Clostridium sp.]
MTSQDSSPRIASGDVIQGDAAVDLGLDGIGDLLVVLADDPYLHPAFPMVEALSAIMEYRMMRMMLYRASSSWE